VETREFFAFMRRELSQMMDRWAMERRRLVTDAG
jgi:hypothetical protein